MYDALPSRYSSTLSIQYTCMFFLIFTSLPTAHVLMCFLLNDHSFFIYSFHIFFYCINKLCVIPIIEN